MIARVQINPAWWEFIRNSIRQAQIYRFQFLSYLVFLCVQIFLLRTVWMGVYDGRDSVDGVSPDALLVYITVSTLQGLIGPYQIAYAIQVRVETGQVANDLIRPFGFLSQMIASQFGKTIGRSTFLIVVTPAAMFIGSLRMPDVANIGPYVLSLTLGYFVNLLIWLLVGLLSFWMMHVNGVRAILGISSDFLAGAVIPLWFMPDALRTVLEFLPFQAGVFLPTSIFMGQVTGSDLIRPLVVQIAWIVLLSLVVRVVWRNAQRRIVVQGG